MARTIANKAWALILLIALPSATIDCGVILHPERNGNRAGRVDVGALVMDCLWLLAGVVPGVVALVVDFASGGMYESGSALNATPGQHLTFHLRGKAPQDAEVTVAIEEPEGPPVVLFNRRVARGEELNPIELALPAGLATGTHSLVLALNKRTKAGWHLNVVSMPE